MLKWVGCDIWESSWAVKLKRMKTRGLRIQKLHTHEWDAQANYHTLFPEHWQSGNNSFWGGKKGRGMVTGSDTRESLLSESAGSLPDHPWELPVDQLLSCTQNHQPALLMLHDEIFTDSRGSVKCLWKVITWKKKTRTEETTNETSKLA